MTLRTNARVAGFTLLFYIAVGISNLMLFDRAWTGQDVGARLASLDAHTTTVGVAYLLSLAMSFSAIVLGVTFHALTKRDDPDLALLGLVCRVAEGVVGATVPTTLLLLWLATLDESHTPNAALTDVLARGLLRVASLKTLVSATFFAVGSTAFCWVLWRARLLPPGLAWLGVASSVLLTIGLPLRLAGFLAASVDPYLWVPMAAFEVVAGLWLMARGIPDRGAPPRTGALGTVPG